MRPSIITRKYFLFFLALIGSFLLLKLPHLSIKLSDTNIYFYNGYQIIQGQILYKDIFFTNFPLVPYASAFYFFISRGSIEFYYLTSILESITVASLIFYVSKMLSKDNVIALFSSGLYLFSFILLATTEHQTGVFLASIFLTLSFLFFTKKNLALTGVFTSLTLLTKAYFIPLAITYGTYLIIKRRFRDLVIFSLTFLLTTTLVMLPSFILARDDFIKDVFEYSLTRSAGLSKVEIIWFFILHDIVIFTLLIINIFFIKKNLFFGLFSIFSIYFILFYQDIYYLYLNFMIPLLCLSLYQFWGTIQKKLSLQSMVIPTILLLIFGINILLYLTGYTTLQKIQNLPAMVNHITEQKPSFLYGTNDITPLLSYLSKVPMLDNITDTNTNLYRKKILHAHNLTKKSIESKTLLIGHGVNYPLYNTQAKMIDEIFDEDLVVNNCRNTANFPIRAEGIINEINIMRCY